MSELSGNLLVASAGGPTAVMNASLAGVLDETPRHFCIQNIYGGLNGILGVLNENLIDLSQEDASTINCLKYTPGAALGTSRYKIDFRKKPERSAEDMDRLFGVLHAHDIHFLVYLGGSDSQDTLYKIHQTAAERGYELRVIGIPKTIDNDIPHTDHCPGYGSAIKYVATTTMEIAADIASMDTAEGSCCIIGVLGRASGWIAAGSILAKRDSEDPPHIILLPEIPFEETAFLRKVAETSSSFGYCVVVVGEGLQNASGQEIAADRSRIDVFGHPVLSTAAEHVGAIVAAKLRIKTRTVDLGYTQRAAAHWASQTDVQEAWACGEAAVRAAAEGRGGFMVKLLRLQKEPYKCTTDLQHLGDIANVEHLIPRDWVADDGFLPNEHFIEYAQPLIRGQVPVQMDPDGGLPRFAALEKHRLERKLPGRN